MASSAVEAYGAQQEICLRSTPDSQGQPSRSPLSSAGALYRLDGRVSLPALREAMRLVSEGADVLRARLRLRPEGYVFAPAGSAGVPELVADLTDAPATRVAHVLRHALAMLGDMQDGPLGVLALVRRADDDLLAAVFDHSVLDQQSALVMVRRLGRVYGHLLAGELAQAERAASPSSFLEFARTQQADATGRAAAAAALRPAVEAEAPPFAFPGGRWMPWHERSATSRHTWQASAADVAAMRRASDATRASFLNLLMAAVSLVAAGLADGAFVPVSYFRNGRQASENGLVGPLWETVATRSPGDGEPIDLAPCGDGSVGAWVRQFALVNAQVPHLRGLSLVHLAPLDQVMELRRIGFNPRMPARPFGFGPHRSLPVDPADVFGGGPGYEPGVPGHNVNIRVFLQAGGAIRFTVQYDPEDLADPGGLLAAVLRVIRMLAERPDTPLGKALAELRRA